ncbi:MAG: hypothetical protein K940chlam3_01214 [Chlamydiae bacterium]|nr:hypothetical protein [Chlamydiota bacterium]
MNIQELPNELLVKVFSFLPHPPNEQQATVCKIFASVSQDVSLWRSWAKRFEGVTVFSEPQIESPTWKTHQFFIMQVMEYLEACCLATENDAIHDCRTHDDWLDRAAVSVDDYLVDSIRNWFRHPYQVEMAAILAEEIPNYEKAEKIREYLITEYVKENYLAYYSRKPTTFPPIELFNNKNLEVVGITTTESPSESPDQSDSLFFSLAKLNTIVTLQLIDLQFERIPEIIRQFTHIRKLDLGGNRFNTLPEWMTEFHNLENLDLGGNSFQTVPEILDRLPSLKKVCMEENLLNIIDERELETLDRLGGAGRGFSRPRYVGECMGTAVKQALLLGLLSACYGQIVHRNGIGYGIQTAGFDLIVSSVTLVSREIFRKMGVRNYTNKSVAAGLILGFPLSYMTIGKRYRKQAVAVKIIYHAMLMLSSLKK